jgi:hypothetical protein
MDKRGMDVPKASGGRGMGFLAGLGKVATDYFTGQTQDLRDDARFRRRMKAMNESHIDRRALDLAAKAAGYDIDIAAASAAAPLMKNSGFARIGSIEMQKEATIRNISEKPNTKNKGGTPRTKKSQSGQPTTEDTGPTSSTSKMKPDAKVKKQTATTRTGGKKTKSSNPSLPSKSSGKVEPAKAEAEAWPGAGPRFGGDGENVIKPKKTKTGKVGDTVTKGGGITEITPAKVKTGQRKNGTSGSTNGNKKGGM